jgi:hypothetical protein
MTRSSIQITLQFYDCANGVMLLQTAKPGDAVRMSMGFTLKIGNFARLAQGTYLLSQALRSIVSRTTEDDSGHHDQTAQLRRTLLALVHAADVEAKIRRLEFCAQSELSLRLAIHICRKESQMQKNLTLLKALYYFYRIITCKNTTPIAAMNTRDRRSKPFGKRLAQHWIDCCRPRCHLTPLALTTRIL